VSGFCPSMAVPPSSSVRLSALGVVLPSDLTYWTVVDEKYEVVEVADGLLRDLRFGAGREGGPRAALGPTSLISARPTRS
jgi:hypothetical protein